MGKGGMRGGFGKTRPNAGMGGNNMQKMLQQAQKLQADMERDKEALAEQEVEATAGGGAVKVVFKGDQTLKSIKIDPDVVDPEDVEMLEDLVMAAVNEGLAAVEKMTEEAMEKYNAGLNGLM